MAENNIALFQNYIAHLDDVYKAESKTAFLDTSDALVSLTAANEFKIPKMSMDGLADYSRKTGYEVGSVTIEFETKKPEYDRARKFRVEAMDNEESAGIAFGSLAAEFIRTRVVPELDAYRFAKLSAQAGKSSSDTLDKGKKVLDAINAAFAEMSENEVIEENRILFITPTLWTIANAVDTTIDKAVLSQFASVVRVPQSRFKSKIELLDGKSTGSEEGGFKVSDDAVDLNFMIVSKGSVIQGTKHRVNKIISPDVNQDGDFWDFFYRAYGINAVYDNKKDGIYASFKAGV